MREWHLTSNHPLTLTLASDARLANADYVNDQIWELTLERFSPCPGLIDKRPSVYGRV